LSVQLLKGEFVRGDLVEIGVDNDGEIEFDRLESGHVPASVEQDIEQHADAE
jgi:hypothetical protein